MCIKYENYHGCFFCDARHYIGMSGPEACKDLLKLWKRTGDRSLSCPSGGVQQELRVHGYIRGCSKCEWGSKR
ncbi:hypothetical protein O9K51_07956 [Purpureocillium lavendulum]|uniref:Uncharacterized protein n=1 Tax=Purpureocillium lavendulum TaxID=1247861 RepID=A0AB34FLL7_9HYPO|nr:hypothetical protein O9K51_07956 [Purpureocillium lavendulum]